MSNTRMVPTRTESPSLPPPIQRLSPSVDPPNSRRRTIGVWQFTLPLRLFLIAGWARAAVEKLIDPAWWSAAALRGFLDEQRPHMLPWFGWLSEHVFEPFAPQVAITVLATQIGIVACLLTGYRVRRALWVGIALNVCFVMAGRVNPSAFYLVMQATFLFALGRPIREVVACRRAAAWLFLATVMAPFIRTIRPREVIDDPASMLTFVAVIAAITTLARSVSSERAVEFCERSSLGRRLLSLRRSRRGRQAAAVERGVLLPGT